MLQELLRCRELCLVWKLFKSFRHDKPKINNHGTTCSKMTRFNMKYFIILIHCRPQRQCLSFYSRNTELRTSFDWLNNYRAKQWSKTAKLTDKIDYPLRWSSRGPEAVGQPTRYSWPPQFWWLWRERLNDKNLKILENLFVGSLAIETEMVAFWFSGPRNWQSSCNKTTVEQQQQPHGPDETVGMWRSTKFVRSILKVQLCLHIFYKYFLLFKINFILFPDITFF